MLGCSLPWLPRLVAASSAVVVEYIRILRAGQTLTASWKMYKADQTGGGSLRYRPSCIGMEKEMKTNCNFGPQIYSHEGAVLAIRRRGLCSETDQFT